MSHPVPGNSNNRHVSHSRHRISTPYDGKSKTVVEQLIEEIFSIEPEGSNSVQSVCTSGKAAGGKHLSEYDDGYVSINNSR